MNKHSPWSHLLPSSYHLDGSSSWYLASSTSDISLSRLGTRSGRLSWGTVLLADNRRVMSTMLYAFILFLYKSSQLIQESLSYSASILLWSFHIPSASTSKKTWYCISWVDVGRFLGFLAGTWFVDLLAQDGQISRSTWQQLSFKYCHCY